MRPLAAEFLVAGLSRIRDPSALAAAARIDTLHASVALSLPLAAIAARNNNFNTRTCIAANTSRVALRWDLVSARASVEDAVGLNVFTIACAAGNFDGARWALAYYGPDVMGPDAPSGGGGGEISYDDITLEIWDGAAAAAGIVRTRQDMRRLALLNAARCNNVAALAWLYGPLAPGMPAMPQAPRPAHFVPDLLVTALARGHVEAVQWLVEHGGVTRSDVIDHDVINVSFHRRADEPRHVAALQWLIGALRPPLDSALVTACEKCLGATARFLQHISAPPVNDSTIGPTIKRIARTMVRARRDMEDVKPVIDIALETVGSVGAIHNAGVDALLECIHSYGRGHRYAAAMARHVISRLRMRRRDFEVADADVSLFVLYERSLESIFLTACYFKVTDVAQVLAEAFTISARVVASAYANADARGHDEVAGWLIETFGGDVVGTDDPQE